MSAEKFPNNEFSFSDGELLEFIKTAEKHLEEDRYHRGREAVARVENDPLFHKPITSGYVLCHKIVYNEDLYFFCARSKRLSSDNPIIDRWADEFLIAFIKAFTQEYFVDEDGNEQPFKAYNCFSRIGKLYDHAKRVPFPEKALDMQLGRTLALIRGPEE